MWYYSFNSSPAGPVNAEALKLLFRSGKITLKTLVWQEGMEDWVEFQKTTVFDSFSPEAAKAAQQPIAAQPFQQQSIPQPTPQPYQPPQQPLPQPTFPQPYQQPYQPVYPQQPYPQQYPQQPYGQPQQGYPAPYQQPYPQPGQYAPGYSTNPAAPTAPYAPNPYYPNAPMMFAPSIPFYKRLKPEALTGTYVTWLVFYVIGILVTLLAFLVYRILPYSLVPVIQYALTVTAAILMLVFLGRCWKIIQDGHASMTPSMAIGNLFIPFFNFYWIFRAYHGLSKDINRFIDRHFSSVVGIRQHKAIPAFSLVYCIFLLVNLAFSITYQIILGSNIYSYHPTIKTLSIISGVIGVIFEVITITMITDYFVSARQLLKNAQQLEQMYV